MELLIPGLILVALMVYASTRIKKTAAAAFDAETIETDDFIIQKPDGFLNKLNGDPEYAFEAYSKEFGGPGAENVRQGTAHLKIYDGVSSEQAVANLLKSGVEITGDISEVVNEIRYRVIEAGRTEKGVELRVFYKIAERNSRTYEFEITALAETSGEFMRKIETMLAGFEVK
ncbi:MAG: hypothetical protein ABJB40_08435 [Acidobacteriota bacterium]